MRAGDPTCGGTSSCRRTSVGVITESVRPPPDRGGVRNHAAISRGTHMIRSIRAFGVLVVGTALASSATAGQGNQLPPGPHFMLNVIAFDAGNCPAGDF